MGQEKPLGPTGRYPDGSMGPHDGGEIQFGISADSNGNIHFNFGTRISWFSMPPEEAVKLARAILQKVGAKKVEVEL